MVRQRGGLVALAKYERSGREEGGRGSEFARIFLAVRGRRAGWDGWRGDEPSREQDSSGKFCELMVRR